MRYDAKPFRDCVLELSASNGSDVDQNGTYFRPSSVLEKRSSIV